MMQIDYQICSRCVMDTSDPEISFDDQGVCNHCKSYDKCAKKRIGNKEKRNRNLQKIVKEIKQTNGDKKYNCIIGVSGGVDSTYVAYKVKELGLNPLAVHLDNGWNSELAVSNIEKTLKNLNIDLYTYVLDWEEFKDLQLAFLKASTPDSEIPTDHAIFGILFKIAKKFKLKHILLGVNLKTEGILPEAWSYGHSDWKYIRNIQNKFGNKRLENFPHYTIFDFIYYKFIKRIKTINLLDYLDYIKADAMKILKEKIGWVDYGGKHYESIYTRFFQGFILPQKFGFDKRRAHLSTLICSGQIQRELALEELRKNPYSSKELEIEDREYVIKKFGIIEEDFERIMNLPTKKFWDYPSYEKSLLFKVLKHFYLRNK